MPLAMIGTIGLSLVWGWLLVLAGRGSARFWRNLVPLILVTLLVALFLCWLSGWPHLLVFSGGTAVALSTHLAWRQKIAAGVT